MRYQTYLSASLLLALAPSLPTFSHAATVPMEARLTELSALNVSVTYDVIEPPRFQKLHLAQHLDHQPAHQMSM